MTTAAAQKYEKTAVYDEDSFNLLPSEDAIDPSVQATYDEVCKMPGVDASETLVFARQLETVKNRIYEKKYVELKGRTFVPFSYEGGEDSEFLVYRLYDHTAIAKIVENYSTDFELVTASAKEFFLKYFDVGNGYQYTIKDLRRAARAGVSVDARLAMAARHGAELAIDDAVAVGVPQIGTYGLTNNPNVSVLSLTNGTWASASGEQMLEDLNSIVTQMQVNSNEVWSPDTILMSVTAFRKVSTKLLNSAGGTTTVLRAFQEQNPGVTVASWTKLSTANASGDNGRIIAFKRDPEVLEFEMGKEFTVHGPVQTGLAWTHYTLATIGGLAVHHPLGIAYFDNQTM